MQYHIVQHEKSTRWNSGTLIKQEHNIVLHQQCAAFNIGTINIATLNSATLKKCNF